MRKFRKHVQLNKRRIYNFLTCVKKLPDTCKIYTHNIDTKIVSVYNIYIYNLWLFKHIEYVKRHTYVFIKHLIICGGNSNYVEKNVSY